MRQDGVFGAVLLDPAEAKQPQAGAFHEQTFRLCFSSVAASPPFPADAATASIPSRRAAGRGVSLVEAFQVADSNEVGRVHRS